MKVFMEFAYEGKDMNQEACAKDQFLRRLYGKGHWRKVGNGLEITL